MAAAAASGRRALAGRGFVAALSIVFSIVFSSAALADEGPLALRYETNAREVGEGDVFQLDVVLTSKAQQPVEELSLPDFAPFIVVREQRGTSTQINMVNGQRQVTVEQRFTYLLRADEAGEFKIGEATARLGRSVARAAPFTIRVVGSDARDDGPAATTRFGKNPPAAFLEVTVDRPEVWVGQQLTVTTEIYTQQPLAQWPRMPPQKPAGFLCQSLLDDDRPQPSQRTVGGKLYYVYLVNKDALFPLAEGDKTIAASEIEVTPAGSFFSRQRSSKLRAPAQKVKVKALPVDGRPARFSPGNVGQWQLSAFARPTQVTLGQPMTLTIIATGVGSLEQLQMPTWEGGASARVFPSQTKIERVRDGEVIRGRVILETLVQPSSEGDLRIPPLSLFYFDPQTGAYKESRTHAITVRVGGAKKEGGATTSTSARQVIEQGPRPIKRGIVAEGRASELPVFIGLAAVGAGAIVFGAGNARARRAASSAGKRDRARREREKAIDEAKKRGDLGAMERILFDVLGERAGADARGRPTDELAPLLSERGLQSALVDDVVRVIRDLESARFMPGAGAERQRLIENAVVVVNKLEGA